MDNYIPISELNDFFFCPYSIYLHNVYMEADEEIYYATPQIIGKIAHASVDNKSYSHRRNDILSLPVCSNELGLIGKIDQYKQNEKLLIEHKFQLKQIYQGQLYQLWAQYLCLLEMGYEVEQLAFYEVSTNQMHPISLPSETDIMELKEFIQSFRNYDPTSMIPVNPKKCKHCIYCSLCDKTELENVYS